MTALPPPIALEDAQRRLLDMAAPLPGETVQPADAVGRYLTADLSAARTQPATDLSAMDGYAIAGGGPWTIIGESAAGHPFAGTALQPGEATRISTGAHLPAGADRVLIQENAARNGNALALAGDAPAPGRHIRRAGFDFRQGDPVLQAGLRLTPARLALALAAGHGTLSVRQVPRIAILDCGDELAADPTRCAPHQIPASNGAMLAAIAASEPCVIKRIGPVADTRSDMAAALRSADDVDLVVTSGGASVGDHDLVRPALEEWGAQLAFWRVAIRPGKPLLVARRGRQLVLGLPGNPVSSFVTAQLFLRPLLRRLAGARECLPMTVPVTLATPLPEGGGRREFLRARWTNGCAGLLEERDSSALVALAGAEMLLDRPAHAPAAETGASCAAILL